MNNTPQSALSWIIGAIGRWVDVVFPSAQTTEQNERLALRRACCGLLFEVARLESEHPALKRAVVAQILAEIFSMRPDETAALTAACDSKTDRYTSYFAPVALINKRWSPQQKVQLVEHLWRVALADGTLDMYEEHLVRKLADLLYVSHTDFILAKHRALGYSNRVYGDKA